MSNLANACANASMVVCLLGSVGFSIVGQWEKAQLFALFAVLNAINAGNTK